MRFKVVLKCKLTHLMPLIENLPALPLSLSIKALEKLKEYNELVNITGDSFIRIGVKKEGAHLKKVLGFDEKRFTDQLYEQDEMSFVIDRRELKHFDNIKLDYKETNSQKGFVFRKVS